MTENNNKINSADQPNQSAQKPVRKERHLIKSIKAKADAKRSLSEEIADWTTAKSGSVLFLVVNIIFFTVWMVINLDLTSIAPFDPFPFGLLTMIVSLEAIMLAIFVLISQNREEKVNDLRDEIALQVEIISEKKIIKILELLNKILEKNRIDTEKDGAAQEMLQPTNIGKIEEILEKQVSKS